MQNIWKILTLVFGGALIGYVGYNVGTKSKDAKFNDIETKTALVTQIKDSLENKEKDKRQRQEKELRESKKKEFISHWGNYVSLRDTSFGWRLVGGCKNMELTITNDSDYKIDEILVKVELYRLGGNQCEQRTFVISDINANSNKTIETGSFSCGVNHKVFLYSVKCNSIDFNYVNTF